MHFLHIAHGSLREVETQILIALRLTYLEEETAKTSLSLADEVGRLINGLIKYLSR